jgi:hypothetical protein
MKAAEFSKNDFNEYREQFGEEYNCQERDFADYVFGPLKTANASSYIILHAAGEYAALYDNGDENVKAMPLTKRQATEIVQELAAYNDYSAFNLRKEFADLITKH